MKESTNWYETAEIYSKAEMHEEAIACYDKALEINQKNVDALEDEGACLLRINKDPEAMECFDKVLEITEQNICAWFNRGVALKEKGKYWDALFSFNRGLELFPDDEDALQCVDEIIKKLVTP